MVKRLVEEEGLDGINSQLAELFRAAAPVSVDPFRKRRILVQLEREPIRKSAARFWLRPSGVATLLVSGTATAAFGHRYLPETALLSWVGETNTSSPAASASVLAAPKKHKIGRSAPAVSAPALVDTPKKQSEAAPGAVHPGKSSPRPRTDANEDATRVVEAIQALRTERDPVRAQGLLDEYLKAHPRGVLSGDALALSIEAASARHDPRAADYARRYLANYPKGKYRDLATRALEVQR